MKAPRLLTRALVTVFVTVALVLGAVFAVLSLRMRDQVRQRWPTTLRRLEGIEAAPATPRGHRWSRASCECDA